MIETTPFTRQNVGASVPSGLVGARLLQRIGCGRPSSSRLCWRQGYLSFSASESGVRQSPCGRRRDGPFFCSGSPTSGVQSRGCAGRVLTDWRAAGAELGLAYASAQLVHVGLVLWIIHIATGPSGAMVFFWIGIFCTYLLALFSWPRLRDILGPRLWRIFRTIALEYIAIAFAADFIVGPLHAEGLGKFRPLYLPFALMLVVGAGLRVARFSYEKLQRPRETLPLTVGGSPVAAQTRQQAWRRSFDRLAGVCVPCGYYGSAGP